MTHCVAYTASSMSSLTFESLLFERNRWLSCAKIGNFSYIFFLNHDSIISCLFCMRKHKNTATDEVHQIFYKYHIRSQLLQPVRVSGSTVILYMVRLMVQFLARARVLSSFVVIKYNYFPSQTAT